MCQNASPSPSPPIALPFSMMFEITEISGGTSLLRPAVWVSTPYFLDQLGRVVFEFAELAGERHVLRVGHRLAAEAQHQIVEPRLADRVAVRGGSFSRMIDAGNVGAEPGVA